MTQEYKRRPYTFDRVARITFTTIGLIAAIYLIDVLKGVLLPFFVACLIAYMLEPVVKWNMKWMHVKKRFLPVVITLLEASLITTILCWIAIPYIVNETTEMADMVKRYATSQINIPYISNHIHDFIRQNLDLQNLSKLLSASQWQDTIKGMLSSSWSFLSNSLAFVFGVASWLVVILYVIFIMLDYERLMLSFRQLVPIRSREKVYKVFKDVESAMNHYFRGQFLIASLVGIMFAIGFLIIGLPMAVVLGLFIGVLNMVPYLQLISLPITAILCIVATVNSGVDFWVIFAESMAVYLIVQGIQDLILTPKIMGKAMGLNPAIMLLSLSIWGALLGFVGLIIALPLTTLVLSYYDQYVVNRDVLTNALESPDDQL